MVLSRGCIVHGVFCLIIVLCFFSNSWAIEQKSFGEYKQYALLANSAYQNREKIDQVVKKDGWVVSHYEIIPGIEVLYYLATNKKNHEQVIVVRGTANVENAMVDAAHKLLPNSTLNIQLHEGFELAAKNIYHAVSPHLKKDYKISTTGHSLGGAVAVIIAMYLDKNKYNLNEVITFGQPKVTNITGALKYKHLALTRIVTPKDLVPLVPPFDAMDVNNLDIYWHLGREIILLPGLEYSEISGLDSMLRASNILSEKLDQNNIENHRMTLYLELINAKLKNSVKVEHKRNFDVFKLFSGS